MTRAASPSRIARALTFLGLSLFMEWLVESGKVTHIVNPRMVPWILGAGLLFLVLAGSEILHLSANPRKPDPASFFYPFAFVLAIAFIFVQANTLSPGRFQATPEQTAFQAAALAQHSKAINKAESGPLPARIAPADDTYWTLYNRLYNDPHGAAGKAITVQGFVYRKPGFPPHAVLIGRNLMWCCSADLAIIGFMAQGPETDALKDDTWVEVKGRLDTANVDVEGKGKMAEVPLITAESIKAVERSASTTIFPY